MCLRQRVRAYHGSVDGHVHEREGLVHALHDLEVLSSQYIVMGIPLVREVLHEGLDA